MEAPRLAEPARSAARVGLPSTGGPGEWQSEGMARSSNPPAQIPPSAPKHLRPELEVLVRALAALPEPERSEVYAAVDEEARCTRGPMLSWDEWEAARGVVSLGGNAVEDCDALCDDA